jgi:chromosome segregation ATPase
MSALWEQMAGLVRTNPRSSEESDAAASPAAGEADRQPASRPRLENVGMRTESLRVQLDEVAHAFAQLDLLKGSFQGLVAPVADLMAGFEAAESRATEMGTKLGLVEEVCENLTSRHAAAVEERDRMAEARDAALRENNEMEQRVERAEAATKEARDELRERVAVHEKLEEALEAETRRNSALTEELRRRKDECLTKDQWLADLEVALKAASDEGALLSQENATLRESSQNLSQQLEEVNRRSAENATRIVEYESLIEQNKQRVAALGQSLAEEQEAHVALRAKHIELVERSRAEAARLGDAVLAVRGRVDVTERLLEQARSQLREKTEELRAAERQLLEDGIHIDALEKSEVALKDDLARANERLAGADRLRRTLVDQVNGLNDELRAKEAALKNAARTIERATARADDGVRASQQMKDELERRIAALQNEVARLHAERRLTDGALEASRAERLMARRPASPLPAERRPATAAAQQGAPEALPANVAKLPYTAG